jgi:hypothetical protein
MVESISQILQEQRVEFLKGLQQDIEREEREAEEEAKKNEESKSDKVEGVNDTNELHETQTEPCNPSPTTLRMLRQTFFENGLVKTPVVTDTESPCRKRLRSGRSY